MAATCIDNIVNQNVSSSGISNAASSSGTTTANESKTTNYSLNSGTTGNGNSKTILTSFTDAVNNLANSIQSESNYINNTDCSQVVIDWINSQLPFSITSVYNDMNSLSSGMTNFSYLGNIKNVPFYKQSCSLVSNWSAMLLHYINIITKLAYVVFDKIDTARIRLKNALLNYTTAIRNCIQSIIKDATNKLIIAVDSTLGVDWDSIISFMNDCPCMTKWIATLTGCTKDDDGNDITDNATKVIACVKKSGIFLDSTELANSINSWVNEYVNDNINEICKYIKKWIKYIFNSIIKPLRKLIKEYSKLLTKKINVNEFIKLLGYSECFFVYTTEYKNGISYYGMSIIDMINTIKGWVTCFKSICPSFTEEMKLKIKEINENLRLDDYYWRRAFEIDLYTMCIANKVNSSTSRDTVMRDLYTDADSGTKPFDSINDSISNMTIPESTTNNSDKTLNTLDQAILFSSSQETENDVNVGTYPITKYEEQILLNIAKCLTNGKDDYFTEKLYQLIRFTNFYAIDTDTYVELKNCLDSLDSMNVDFNSHPVRLFSNNDNRSEIVNMVENDKENYFVASEYNDTIVNKFLEIKYIINFSDLSTSFSNIYSQVI